MGKVKFPKKQRYYYLQMAVLLSNTFKNPGQSLIFGEGIGDAVTVVEVLQEQVIRANENDAFKETTAITREEADEINHYSAATLYRVGKYFKERGNRVFLIGISVATEVLGTVDEKVKNAIRAAINNLSKLLIGLFNAIK